jgi:hypothetical protein
VIVIVIAGSGSSSSSAKSSISLDALGNLHLVHESASHKNIEDRRARSER